MSSVDFKKNGYTSGAAMVAHFTRHDGREVEYKNGYIDPTRSKDNFCIGGGRFGAARVEPQTAEQIMQQLRQRVQEIDAQQPPKRLVKDRVTIMTYSIAAPEDLPPDKEEAFFRLVWEEVAKMSGGYRNVSQMWVHKDELHDYIAAGGERKTSRTHGHMAGVPYTEEKGINGKAFETKARMAALNRAIDQRCRLELGVKFMTGEKGLTGRTVEELQAASETRAKRQERAKINAALKDGREEVRQLESSKARLQGDLARLQQAKDVLALEVEDMTRQRKAAQEALKTAQEGLEEVRAVKHALEQDISVLRAQEERLGAIKWLMDKLRAFMRTLETLVQFQLGGSHSAREGLEQVKKAFEDVQRGLDVAQKNRSKSHGGPGGRGDD